MGVTRRYIYALAFILPAAYCCLAAFGPAAARAQDPVVAIEPRVGPRADNKGSADRSTPHISVDADLVLIPVMVTDHHDRLITGLEKEHFKLFEDKVEQSITHFAAEDAPVSIALVFDCSGSMGPKLAKSRAAVAEFIRTANPEDEFSLFSSTTALNWPSASTARPRRFRAGCSTPNREDALLCWMPSTWRWIR